MLKKIQMIIYKLLVFVTSLLIISYSVQHKIKNKETIFNATIFDSSVQSLFNELLDEQDDVYLSNYSSVYFYNLSKNYPINSHGTCSYVGICMLLSFFDSYWNNNFIGEELEQKESFDSLISLSENINVPPLNTESPGVISENWEEVEELAYSEYLNFTFENEYTYMQSNLIRLAYNMFDSYCFDSSSNPFGMTLYQQTSLIKYYLSYKRSIYNSLSYVTSVDNYNQEILENYIISRISDGIPVMINAYSTVGYHSIVAYDYNPINGTIYVHSGWKDQNGNSLNHVSLSQLGISMSSICSAVSIDPTNDCHEYHSQNYVSSDESCFCSCQMVFPKNIQVTSSDYIDINLSLKWDSLYEEKWYRTSVGQPYIELSILNHNLSPLIQKYIYSGNEYVLASDEWYGISVLDPYDDYLVQLKICSPNYEFMDNSCNKQFNKPTSFLNGGPIIVTPLEYSGYSSEYSTSSDLMNSFSTHMTSNGYLFKTRRFRAGRLENNSIVISPKKRGYTCAFVEYQFVVPVDRIDIDLSFWGDKTFEGLNSSNGKAVIEVYRYGEYADANTVLDLLNPSVDLSEDRDEKNTYKLCFGRPITRFRIYAETNNMNISNLDKGRICVGDIKIYESRSYLNHGDYVDFELSGSEINYNPSVWNSNEGIRENNNCYSYAIDVLATSHINPGQIGCTYYNRIHDSWNNLENYLSASVFFDLVQFDSDIDAIGDCYFNRGTGVGPTEFGFAFNEIDKDENISPGSYRIALAFDLESELHDYHWYRQNKDGTWSHKPGDGEVRDFDFDGNPILDPEFCNRKSSPDVECEENEEFNFNYSTFIGFYSVMWISY